MSVFHDIDDCLLSWYDARALRIIPDTYPKQISSLQRSKDSTSEDCRIEEALQALIQDYPDVLVDPEEWNDGTILNTMVGPPMQIHLRQDAQPFARHTPNSIPLDWMADTKALLEKMVSQEIIAPVGNEASAWCHPMVITSKKTGGVRITIDMSKLNCQVLRSAHLFPSPRSAVIQVTHGSRYFSTLDAMWGYWQLPLDEASQHLTTFVTPWGRYKFLRGPMGFISTGDEFCRRGDLALEGIGDCAKIVDDVLV